MSGADDRTAVIVGAGLSGICMGIALRQMEIDFIILEKTGEIGGTWSRNKYPGCGCDIPMFAYCYSFEQFHGSAWPKQPEILEYLKHCARKYDIEDRILLNSGVQTAEFDAATGRWNLELQDSRMYSARFLINATGQLDTPNIPALEGSDSFSRPVVHSAMYPADFDIRDKTVAVLGNGATALQLVESLQPQVKELLVFARSPKYVYPRVKYSAITLQKMSADADYWRQVRSQFTDAQDRYRLLLDDFPRFDPFDRASKVREFYASSSTDFGAFDGFYDWMNARNMRPDYPTGCSRPLVADTFHEAIRAANVNLISDAIRRFKGQSIQTSAAEYPVDLVILATGFSLNNLVPPYTILGSGGVPLAETWSAAPAAYLGMAVAGYPNLFLLYGPNTNTNSSSVTFFVESQVNYIRQIVREYRDRPFASIEIKPDVLERYCDWLTDRNRQVSESSACSSWYRNQDNLNISTFPGGFRDYEKLTQRFVPSEFHIAYAPAKTAGAGARPDAPHINDSLIGLFAQTTQLPVSEISLATPLREFALDSILITDFIRRVNGRWSLALEPSIFFEHSSLQELAACLVSLLPPESPRQDHAAQPVSGANSIPPIPEAQIRLWKNRRTVKRPQLSKTDAGAEGSLEQEPVAIIGAHGYFPQSPDLETFWDNLIGGRDCISEVPPQRWDWKEYYGSPQEGDKTRVKWGGFIEGVDLFDPLFFKMSPKEAELMDPQHRLFLQCAWQLFESAGYNPQALSGRKIGVILGINLNDYAELVAKTSPRHEVLQMSGLMHLFAPNRLSYLLGFTGPSEVIDTACSSSLVAIHRAIQSIRHDRCEMVLAGGSNLILTPKMHLLYSKAGMLAEDGRCKTFSSRANGYVRGEGVAAVLLKRLSAAQRDGDAILGVIRGSAANHGGKANSLTAPNPLLQAALIEEAMLDAGVDPRTIGYIECHGTGTALGDPVEINGIQKAYRNLYQHYGLQPPALPHCGLGSVKSNVGHLETAAGIAGVIKVLLCFKHRQLPQTLHCSPVNPQIHLEQSPFYLVRESRTWESAMIEGEAQPRRAGISSFGAGGSNAHLVLEEYPARQPATGLQTTAAGPAIILLSARTPQQLRRQAQNLLAFVRKQSVTGNDADQQGYLHSIAYTLQVGRLAMEERLGFIAGSMDEMAGKLGAYIDGARNIEHVWQGRAAEAVDQHATAINRTIAADNPSELLQAWIKGAAYDWDSLYGAVKPRRIALPVYPFAEERHWIDTGALRQAPVATSVLHPLLHTNTSNLERQSYSSTFSGEEFFLRDHQVNIGDRPGQKVLPAVAYLEMARAAIESALPAAANAAAIELRDIVWMQPVVVGERTQVTLVLSAGDPEPDGGRRIDYEIRGAAGERETVHCRGSAVSGRQSAPAQLDLAQLRSRMQHGVREAHALYEDFTSMGLYYGPAHRGLVVINQGEGELLAGLELPSAVAASRDEYRMHPSLMDSALQACIGLVADPVRHSGRPPLPFALESLRILADCASEMYAWVRYSAGSHPGNRVIKLDIDLCDREGIVCVQLHGFSTRFLENEIGTARGSSTHDTDHDQAGVMKDDAAFDDAFYRNLIEGVLNNEISVDEAVELG